MNVNAVQSVIVALPAMLLAITLHEVAHGWVAERLGDPTARMLGRLTINPLKHLDPLGLFVFIFSMLQGFGIGWAKPVPVSPANFENPRRGMMWVALAGPVMNLLLAFLSLVVLRSMGLRGWGFLSPIPLMIRFSLQINLILAAFNLIPIPPLDGGRILTGLLPRGLALSYSRIEPYGFYLIIGLLVVGALDTILRPMYMVLATLVFTLGGVS